MSMLRYGQYGQVGADGVWRDKERDSKKPDDKNPTIKTDDKNPTIKTDDKNPTIKTDDKKGLKSGVQQEQILNYMKDGKEYRLQDFCDLLGVKETRTKEILKPLISEGKIIVIGRNKDRRYKLG